MATRWRSPVDPGAPHRFAPWVRDLTWENGVYAIRSAANGSVLYVGESHIGRLYDTMTRHLQHWGGYNAGPSYDRTQVECKAHITAVHRARCPVLRPGGGRACSCGAAQQAIDLQDAWILRLKPLENRIVPKRFSTIEDDEIPF